MKIKSETITFEWKAYEPGDRVKPSSPKCSLPPGIYTVRKFYDPSLPFECDGTVILEGRKFGFNASHLTLVKLSLGWFGFEDRTKTHVIDQNGKPICNNRPIDVSKKLHIQSDYPGSDEPECLSCVKLLKSI